MLAPLNQRGDTLIEVLFAITVFSLVVVMSLALMNQGTQASLRSLQLTLVRQQVDSQAETLRFLNSSYIAAYTPGFTAAAATGPAQVYAQLLELADTSGLTNSSEFGAGGSTTCPNPPSGSFILNTRRASLHTTLFRPAETIAEVQYDTITNDATASYGLWVEPIRAAGDLTSGYTDFHIRACWPAPGLGTPMSTGTIVRLYEPRG